MARKYIRKCQECLHEQEAKDPKSYKDQKSESWRDLKCKKCKSEGSMDYGSWREDENNEDSAI